ncbi:hypothetical protein MJO28_014262 [Puccinia striiformis f. sp. tritici]|uniref:Major facilitator superfamily (MFS) profile domain-containing protein n=2 Tax=Puccinia striiformis TaxID=27350 RepID=A0A2S4V3Z9_9BASI|nr:hypothetical protein Pst134EA_026722 [Puccinia striiformis f. sp. tritici]KAH9450009.1 hypothetical protein Pst134EA_026722 [Puccinia striiformis f. sp. tritici]KAI7938683.1 hypothetical protein MJO28_014262 [Puccinia striiformis f. sp. tritici]KAI7939395.1 hypothetical protein MJO29_014131 [Puccinia striiformis f. sp. tritici]POW04262.1 hypothetical protein PSHT_11305 [Puccinia striiformis]
MARASPSVIPSQSAAEQQPLLLEPDVAIDQSTDHDDHVNDSNRPPTPLPLKQLFVLCVMRLTEPVSFTVIFPFINKMIEDLNIVPRTQVGTYAGLIESLFALAQFSTVLFWGRLSDRIGRKPVLLTGLMGLCVGIIAFGLQRTFLGLVIARSFAGAMNGNIAVVKSSLAEITDETNKARAFPLLPLCWAFGLMIGPAIGGYTAEPARQYPNSIFAKYTFFSTYPYFIPCFLAGLLNIFAVVLGILYLEETLPSKLIKAQRRPSEDLNDDSLEEQERSDSVERAPALKDLLTKHLVIILISFGLMGLENSAWMAIVPLFSYTRVEDGGLGLTLDQIGMTLSSNGVVALVVQSVLFPILHRRLGAVQLHRFSRLSSPIAFIGLPIVRVISHSFPDQSSATTASIVGMIIVIAVKSIGNMTIVCMALLINDSAPNHASLGSINGLGQSVSSFARAISPLMVGKLFSITLASAKSPDSSVILKNLIWYYFVIVALIGYSTSWMIEVNKKKPTPHHHPERAPLLSNRDEALPSPIPGRGEQQGLLTNAESATHYGT